MQFRSLHSLARRTLAAGATSALALTLFNAVQPGLDTHHRIGSGTIKDVPVTLVATSTASPEAGSPGAVDNAASSSAESATLPLRGAEPGAGLLKAAPATGAGSVKAGPGAGARLLSTPVPVGKARFVGGVVAGAGRRTAGEDGGQGLAARPDGCRVVGLAGGRAGRRRVRP